MQADMTEGQVRDALRRFQEGYTSRDLARLDEFMHLFVQEGDPELIGFGASVRGGNEWFEGPDAIRERHKGKGHAWPFVLTAVLGRTGEGWQFHTIHWSMPVD